MVVFPVVVAEAAVVAAGKTGVTITVFDGRNLNSNTAHALQLNRMSP